MCLMRRGGCSGHPFANPARVGEGVSTEDTYFEVRVSHPATHLHARLRTAKESRCERCAHTLEVLTVGATSS
jgi:hypothetical protein